MRGDRDLVGMVAGFVDSEKPDRPGGTPVLDPLGLAPRTAAYEVC